MKFNIPKSIFSKFCPLVVVTVLCWNTDSTPLAGKALEKCKTDCLGVMNNIKVVCNEASQFWEPVYGEACKKFTDELVNKHGCLAWCTTGAKANWEEKRKL